MSVVDENQTLTGQSVDIRHGGLEVMKAWAEDVERRASGDEEHGQDTVTRPSRDIGGREEKEEKLDPNGGHKEEEASLNDVQEALRRNFVNAGVIDKVTARLRRQFILELRRKGLGVPGAREAVAARCRPAAGISLRERVLNSLVVDHLMSNGLLQSLAVFLPESGLGTSATAALEVTVSDGQDRGRFMAAALSREDILRGLPVPPESALFRRVIRRVESGGAMDVTEIAATEESPRERREGVAVEELHRQERRVCGLLNALLAEVAARSSAVAVDTNTQTDEPGRSHKENLVMRLESVRDAWLKRAADERREPARDVTERMLGFQRDCEARAAAQLKSELEIFKERELSSLRLQMAATQRRELDAMRKELQAQYDARVEGLEEAERERERRNVERLRNAEGSHFEARQSLLRELDILRTREQEIRRGAELDARGIRAEERRLRDLAASLEVRSEDVRRREREGVRARETALEAAKLEARQALEVREEGVAREREFLRQEMEALRAERKACQEQLSQHAETARALQEARSEALAQEARAAALEADMERAVEQAAAYREAYETNREVVEEGDRAYVCLGRAELERKLRSAKASLEESRGRHAEAMRRVNDGRDALEAEVKHLREREPLWENEATELRHALASIEIEKDRAKQRADDIECERTALEAQVEALTAALRRSRDAIEAIRLCDAEAEASSRVAPGDSTAFDSPGNPMSGFPAPVDGVPKSVETIAGGVVLRRRRFGGSISPPPSCESWHGRPSGPMSSAGEWWSFDGGRDWDAAAAIVVDEEDRRRVSRSLGVRNGRAIEHRRRQPKQGRSLSCRGGRIGDSGAGGEATVGAAGPGRGSRGRRARRGDVTSDDTARFSCSESGYGSSLSMLIDDGGRPSRRRLCDEEMSRGCCRRSEKLPGGGDKRGNAAESLLEAETERMARELEEKRASFWEQETVREEGRRREREAQRVHREEAEVHAMRMRLAEEEDKAAAAKAAAVTNRLLKESQVVERRETLREEGGSSWVIMRGGLKEGISTVVRETSEKAKEASEGSPPIELMARLTTEQTMKEVAVRPTVQFNTEKSRESNKSGEKEGDKGCEQIAAEEPEFPERCGGESLEGKAKKSKEVLSAAAAVRVTEEFEVSPREGQVVRSTERGSRALQPQPAIPPPGSPTASVAVLEAPVDHTVAAPEMPLIICAAKDEDVAQREREDSDGPHSVVASREREQHRDVGATAEADAEGGGSSETREGESCADNVKSCVGGGGSDSGGGDTAEDVEYVDPSTISKAKADREVEAYREKVRRRRQQQPKEHAEASVVVNVSPTDDWNSDQGGDAVAAAAEISVAGSAPQGQQGQGSVNEIPQTLAGAGGTSTGTTVGHEVGGDGEIEAGRSTAFDSDFEIERCDLDESGACSAEASSVSSEGSGMLEESTGGGSADDWF